MWLKLLGSGLVIIAGAAIGFSLARRYSERPCQIRQLICCLTALESYINYVSLPLSEALLRACGSIDGPVRELFTRMAGIIERSGWVTPGEALNIALAETGNILALQRAETEMLLLLGANLGFTNREEQRKYLEMVVQELEKIQFESLSARDRNVKMYRYLGICGGLAVVILLV